MANPVTPDGEDTPYPEGEANAYRQRRIAPLQQLREDIHMLVLYNWSDELRDYEDCLRDDASSAEGHIFLTLKRLRTFIGEEE